MHAFCKLVTLGVVVAFASAVAVTVSAQTNPHFGTWKMNAAKSTFSPGPAQKSETIVYAAAGQGVKFSAEGVNGDGSKFAVAYTANYDGRDVPVTGAIDEAVSLKRINATAVEETGKKSGKVVRIITDVVSADGKSLTSTWKGVNAEGQAVNNVIVYDRQ